MLVPYAIDEIFQLVNDVEGYEDFLPGCDKSVVLNPNSTSYEARLDLFAYGMHEQIVTRNTPNGNRTLRLELLEGPFKQLEGCWTFTDYGEGCRVTLDLMCEFQSKLLNAISPAFVKRGVEKTVEAFVKEVRRRHDSG